MLNTGELTSEEIVICYWIRASTIGREMNLIGDTNLKEALDEARRCDEIRKITKDKSKLGLLYGIPISVKDNIK